MRANRIFSSAGFLFVIFLIQESAISRINFPVGGFSVYIAVLMAWLAMEDRSSAVIIGFIGGIILDLSPTIDAPFGQWALVMTVMGYLFAANRESIGNFSTKPATSVAFVCLGASLALTLYTLAGLLLGENNGSFSEIALAILGNAIWTLLFSPIILPILSKFRRVGLTPRERI
jgi:rod shape-determining protein MreD